jgi:hypothetical protein
MNLYFHQETEDFSVAMSLLSIFHQDLHAHWLYYASCTQQIRKLDVNHGIILQGFFNFLQVMNYAKSAEEIV